MQCGVYTREPLLGHYGGVFRTEDRPYAENVVRKRVHVYQGWYNLHKREGYMLRQVRYLPIFKRSAGCLGHSGDGNTRVPDVLLLIARFHGDITRPEPGTG